MLNTYINRKNNKKVFDKYQNIFNDPSCGGYKRFEKIIYDLPINRKLIAQFKKIICEAKNDFGIMS